MKNQLSSIKVTDLKNHKKKNGKLDWNLQPYLWVQFPVAAIRWTCPECKWGQKLSYSVHTGISHFTKGGGQWIPVKLIESEIMNGSMWQIWRSREITHNWDTPYCQNMVIIFMTICKQKGLT